MRRMIMILIGLASSLSGNSKANAASLVKTKPASKAVFNMHYPDAVGDLSQLGKLEKRLKYKFHAFTVYRNWEEDLDPALFGRIHDNKLVPQLVWESMAGGQAITNDEIAAGAKDVYLKRNAIKLKQLGFPIRISVFPEMNGDWEPWYVEKPFEGKKPNTPENHKAAWRHIVELFQVQGATNVEWVWCPNILYGGQTSYRQIYPGDKWVDYVGLDGYNWGTGGKHAWQTFRQVFQPSYIELTKITTKPILIMETACSESGGNKAEWIRRMWQDLPMHFPRVKEVTWFNERKERPWDLASTPEAEKAFRECAQQK